MNKFYLAILFVFVSVFVLAQTEADQCTKSTEGTNFWFGFMENRNQSLYHFIEISVSARETTNFKLFTGSSEILFGSYTVNANQSLQIKIPWELAEAVGSETVQDKGVHLIAEKPVNVYALSWDVNSADVALIYPVGSLGKEYFAVCYYPDIDPAFGNGKNSEFLIVAAEDSTTVEITPSKVTHLLKPADSTFTVQLNKGEVYQVQSENDLNTRETGQGDLTGSFIKSNKPVAFYSGSLATRVPSGNCCWDHLFEQIPPVHTWGRQYFTVPLKSREMDRYRILAAEDNTNVQITGRLPLIVDRGGFEEVVFYNDDPKQIIADKPILVVQYSQSNSVDSTFSGGDGDPFMIILSSVTQTKNDVTFATYESPEVDIENYEGIKKYFVNVVAKTRSLNSMQFDGVPFQDEFQPFPKNSEYSFAQKEIDPNVHRIQNLSDDGFLAYVYGFGGLESFGYGVGFNLDFMLELWKGSSTLFFERDTMLLCYGDTLTLDAGQFFDNYNWNTGESSQKIKVNKEGWYFVEASTIDGCILEDSVFVYISHPVTNIGDDIPGECEPFSIELDAKAGFEKYLWKNESGDTLSEAQTFLASQTGEYQVTVFDKYNCTARDKIKMVIFPVPDIETDKNVLVCGKKTTTLNLSLTGVQDSIWSFEGNFNWYSDNPSQLILSDERHTSANIEVPDWGDYEVYYQLTTIDNCVTYDTFHVSFYPVPSSSFNFVENPNDECENYSREIAYTGNSGTAAQYNWDFDGSQLIDSLGWNNYRISLGINNSNPVLQLVVEENGCFSDTTRRQIGANPDFIMQTAKSRGCDSLIVYFEGELQIPDSLLFKWNFGDNSPVSNVQNPSHSYSQPGFYDVSLSITNLVSGCEIGFQIDDMVKVFQTPTAAISADPNFCYPDSAQIYYPFNIDSTIAFWQFEGIHQVGNGNDSITVILDQPTGTVRLSVDEYGCISDTAEIHMKRKPNFDFSTEILKGCIPFSAKLVAEPFDDLLTFNWITDTLPYPEGDFNVFEFQDSGKFDIGLIASSAQTGCTDTLIKNNWIFVFPKPSANFKVNFPVAMIEHSDITFTNMSVNASYYYWDFGDNQFSNEINPIHTFESLGEFTTELIAEAESGCTDTTDFLVTILPTSSYTPNAFRPDSPIEVNRTFMPVGKNAYQFNFKLKVYDRWGQLIFETTSTDYPWDGTTQDGNPAPTGNYIWISDFIDVQGFEHHQKGQVLLLR